MSYWIDTHCHLDAQEFWPLAQTIREQAATNHVAHCVLPAVQVANFEAVRALAHANGDSYALGIHPLYVAQADDADLAQLDTALQRQHDDPRLVAVGEIGLDYFVPDLCQSPLRERQEYFFREQLRMARRYGLPVILHVRRSVDQVLKSLRDAPGSARGQATGKSAHAEIDQAGGNTWHGIAHAFNGSEQQAQAFIKLGFKLGFGGALTFERALNLRRLAGSVPLEAIVMETDAPDMPPHWLYQTAQQRADGAAQAPNTPGELPRIGLELAALRGIPVAELAAASTRNARAALPRLRGLLDALDQ